MVASVIIQCQYREQRFYSQGLDGKWEGRLIEFNGESDHVHLLLQYNPQMEPSKLINNLKTVSSRYLRKEFADEINQVYWKEVFWTNGYFVANCGGVTVEQLKKYIDEQNRPTE